MKQPCEIEISISENGHQVLLVLTRNDDAFHRAKFDEVIGMTAIQAARISRELLEAITKLVEKGDTNGTSTDV